jgi:hypothetical protein
MAAPAGTPARRAAHGVAEVYHDKLDILKHASRNVVSTLAETAAKAESKASTFRSHFNIFDGLWIYFCYCMFEFHARGATMRIGCSVAV